MTQPRWLDERESAMWRSFVAMQAELERALEIQLAEHGLSHADYAVLVVLSELDPPVIRVRDLGNQIHWESSRLAHHLGRMERRGLISRSGAVDDRRGTLVTLTPTGLQAIRGAAPGHVEAVRRYLIDLLDAGEIAAMTAIAQRVRDAIAGPPD